MHDYMTHVPERYQAPLRLFIVTAVSIFISEALVMFLISLLPPLSIPAEAFFDALSLTIIVSPLLYLFLYRPLIRHIRERKKAEEERERVIVDLREALSKVKTLSGLLPICMSCKKIRDDKGYWNQLEAYISEYSDAEFSHSICPECARKLYPELYDDRE